MCKPCDVLVGPNPSIKKKKLYLWLIWVFVAALGLSLVAVSGGLLSGYGTWVSTYGGFSSCGAWAPGMQASHGLSTCGSQVLEHRLISCGAHA